MIKLNSTKLSINSAIVSVNIKMTETNSDTLYDCVDVVLSYLEHVEFKIRHCIKFKL